MSTVIYGDIIRGGAGSTAKIRGFLAKLHQLQSFAQAQQDLLIHQVYLNLLVNAADEAICCPDKPVHTPQETRLDLEARLRKASKNRGEGFGFERYIELCWTIHKSRILYIPFTAWNSDTDWLREELGSEPYSYDNRTDPPDGVTERQHQVRGKVWDEVLAPTYRPSSLSTVVLAAVPEYIPYQPKKLLEFDPPLEIQPVSERAGRIARSILESQLSPTFNLGRDWYRFVTDIKDPSTPIGCEFSILKAKFSALLPAQVTQNYIFPAK